MHKKKEVHSRHSFKLLNLFHLNIFEKIIYSFTMVTFMVLVLFLLTHCMAGASNKQQIIDEILTNSSYDKRVPPGADLGGDLNEERPTNVSVQLFITQLYDVNVDDMDFSISFYLRQKWKDHRLKFAMSNVTLQLSKDDIDKIWTPDTFLPESKTGKIHRITKPNTMMHLQPDGTVLYSLRLHATLGCSMDFHLYPMDVQTCTIRLESYGFTSKKLIYSWEKKDPVIVKNENLPLYDTHEEPRTSEKTCNLHSFQEGFSCLEADLVFDRSIGYYMTETFIPDILIVILSWVSFWLHPLAVPGRVSLGAVTVLTMTSQSSDFRRNAPKVSYVKAIDVWSLFQIMFVFAALVEFSIVNVIARKKISKKQIAKLAEEREKTRESLGNSVFLDKDEDLRPYLSKAKLVDRISRVAFPALYLFFNFMFWVIVSNV